MGVYSTKKVAVLIAMLGVVLFSAKAVMVKLVYQYEVDTVTLLLFRMMLSLPFYLLVAMLNWSVLKSKLTVKIAISVVVFGFLGYYLASYFDFLGLQYIKASLERIILFIYPTVVLVLSSVFLKRKITRVQVLAILITYLGIVIMYYQEPNFMELSSLLGVGLIVLSALTYASYLVGSDWLIPQLGSTLFTSLAMMVSCVCVCLHYAVVGDFQFTSYPHQVYWLSLAMAIFSTVIPSYLISYAIKILGAPNFSVIASLGPVSTIVLAWMFLGETLSWGQILGAIVVIGGVYVVTQKK
ncbi:DMT family transporter [Reichenbachiella agarivorans]|uniref:DMT family transporter n=1 Tax=Reichenbachiella agarivorans TaxID=2979464 RepID=A0ABY6CPZ8_9BACT|nr:DMT family transporter [Reichenbachiella agarivorans]UXP32600.1 DMT family transporter [Reichenbachiella agarivorans]